MRDKIVVLDFGSQYAHLIAKRFRLLGYYSEIALPSADLSELEGAKGIVLSGGPASIYDDKAPEFNSKILNLDIPILGLCYGHYVVSQGYGAKIGKAPVGEFGIAKLNKNEKVNSPLLEGLSSEEQVWMSHQDGVLEIAPEFEVIASTKDCPYAGVQCLSKKRFGLQCHVEVKDTINGNKILQNFANICGMEKNWSQDTVLDYILESIKKDAKDKKVLLFLSGGVDSTVAFALLNKALGQDRVLGLHIDNGFMRKNESANIEKTYKAHGFSNFIVEDASKSFLNAIADLKDPQEKRKAVGENFITVRNEVVAKLNLNDEDWLLAQGTLYPDIIESGGTKNSNTIKTHHNRVDGIQALIAKGLIIEPLKDLYKDEVRLIGKNIGLSDQLVMRHPFPGPGLSINVLCTKDVLSSQEEREFNKAFENLNALDISEFYSKDQASLSVLPVKSVGVQGDFRTYRFPAVIRLTDNKIYDWEKLEKTSSYITNSISDVNRTILAIYENQGCSLYVENCDKTRLDMTREVDDIVLTALHESLWYSKIFQHLTINLPYAKEKGRCSIVLRPVCSEDVMTARFAHLPQELLDKIVSKIKALGFVDNLYYDITNKPPATFGWE
ncbi:MAG: glutamine-hydrolyzing GMP synthase [Treponemataceae bacterium]|nr:glutamine-hydrolyzing GMP synthase [Treponemataceae bacterium]